MDGEKCSLANLFNFSVFTAGDILKFGYVGKRLVISNGWQFQLNSYLSLAHKAKFIKHVKMMQSLKVYKKQFEV